MNMNAIILTLHATLAFNVFSKQIDEIDSKNIV